MSTRFPVKKFCHVSSGATVEGEVILESSTAWQVAVTGSVRILDKSEFQEVSGLGMFNDLFKDFFGGES